MSALYQYHISSHFNVADQSAGAMNISVIHENVINNDSEATPGEVKH